MFADHLDAHMSLDGGLFETEDDPPQQDGISSDRIVGHSETAPKAVRIPVVPDIVALAETELRGGSAFAQGTGSECRISGFEEVVRLNPGLPENRPKCSLGHVARVVRIVAYRFAIELNQISWLPAA